jgi:hypothetical protein
MKYINPGKHDHIPEERSWEYDDFGNRICKETGDFVVLVAPYKEEPQHEIMNVVNIDGEWIPVQMEFDFREDYEKDTLFG